MRVENKFQWGDFNVSRREKRGSTAACLAGRVHVHDTLRRELLILDLVHL